MADLPVITVEDASVPELVAEMETEQVVPNIPASAATSGVAAEEAAPPPPPPQGPEELDEDAAAAAAAAEQTRAIAAVIEKFAAATAPREQDLIRCFGCAIPRIGMEATFKVCSICKRASYCSVECQKSDWKKHHKKLCTAPTLTHRKDTGPVDANTSVAHLAAGMSPAPKDWEYITTEEFDDQIDLSEGLIRTDSPHYTYAHAVRIKEWVFTARRMTVETALERLQASGYEDSGCWGLVGFRGKNVFIFRIEFISINEACLSKVILLMFGPDLLPGFAKHKFDDRENAMSKIYRQTATMPVGDMLRLKLADGVTPETPAPDAATP